MNAKGTTDCIDDDYNGFVGSEEKGGIGTGTGNGIADEKKWRETRETFRRIQMSNQFTVENAMKDFGVRMASLLLVVLFALPSAAMAGPKPIIRNGPGPTPPPVQPRSPQQTQRVFHVGAACFVISGGRPIIRSC